MPRADFIVLYYNEDLLRRDIDSFLSLSVTNMGSHNECMGCKLLTRYVYFKVSVTKTNGKDEKLIDIV